MGILSLITGKHFDEQDDDEQQAEAYLREQTPDEQHITALVRHYAIEEVTDDIEWRAGIKLSDEQTVRIVQKLRNEYGCGPIAEYNKPGYISPEDYPEDQAAQQAYYDERNAVRASGRSYAEWVVGGETDEERDEADNSGGGFFGWLFGR